MHTSPVTDQKKERVPVCVSCLRYFFCRLEQMRVFPLRHQPRFFILSTEPYRGLSYTECLHLILTIVAPTVYQKTNESVF